MIDITPFDPERCESNSYDLTLADKIGEYNVDLRTDGEIITDPDERILDMKEPRHFSLYRIPGSGFVLEPGTLYIGSTVERTACAGVVPYIDGRSSVGRLGLFLHVTAGRGDDGFGLGTPRGVPGPSKCVWSSPFASTPVCGWRRLRSTN